MTVTENQPHDCYTMAYVEGRRIAALAPTDATDPFGVECSVIAGR